MDKKEMVIETARNLFTEYGYKKVSMDELARKSGVTKKTIYTYFKDKDSIFKYFIDEELNHMKNYIEKVEKSNKSFIEQLTEAIYELLDYRKNSKFFNQLANEIKQDSKEKINSFMKLYDDEIISYIEEKITKEINEEKIKKCDAHLSAFILYKLLLSIMFEYDGKINEKKVASEVLTILEEGLLNKKEDEA